ncbi:hypothetical protein E2562_032959 [Oryza meyeriana var. granulata]|uniref:Uncharacterized protein n=1 Tax=Oryza meyeriana var. granulata TaxID=110450 RepID=A0A6G1D9Y3_9ORYZ|nr:hypothetical protein E2562_032959 [Oryza meyeriana var. granulata]
MLAAANDCEEKWERRRGDWQWDYSSVGEVKGEWRRQEREERKHKSRWGQHPDDCKGDTRRKMNFIKVLRRIFMRDAWIMYFATIIVSGNSELQLSLTLSTH